MRAGVRLNCRFSCIRPRADASLSMTKGSHMFETLAQRSAPLAFLLSAGVSGAAVRPALMIGKQPLRFEETNPHSYVARGPGYSLWLRANSSTLLLTSEKQHRSATIRTRFLGSDRRASLQSEGPLEIVTNYLIGNQPAQWRTHVPNWERVRSKGLYPGVDLLFYGHDGQIEYDLIVAPGAGTDRITLEVEGTSALLIEEDGSLALETAAGTARWKKPVIYEMRANTQTPVNGRFVLRGQNRVGFQIDRRDPQAALVIDPTLSYASYFGGSGNESAVVGLDAAGNFYLAGYTTTQTLPVTAGTFQPAYGGETSSVMTGDAFLAKFNSSGKLQFLTYFGGSGDDVATAVAVDATGNAYLTGYTNSTNFPVTASAVQKSFAGFGGNQFFRGGDAFVAKFSSSGSLLYSTYLGGTSDDQGLGIAIDSSGNAYVVGTTLSRDFPISANAFQKSWAGDGGEPTYPQYSAVLYISGDVFVAKLNPTGSQLIFSTYLGGSDDDFAARIAVDAGGNVYVAGYTLSGNFPVTSKAFQRSYQGTDPNNVFFNTGDGFVSKLNPSGSALIYSTFLGGTGDDAINALAVDSSGVAHVAGTTTSLNFPVTSNAFQRGSHGPYNLPLLIDFLIGDAFYARISADGSSLSYSTYFGGSGQDAAMGLAVDALGNAHIGGTTASPDFPVTSNAAQKTYGGGGGMYMDSAEDEGDGFLTVFDSSGALAYSSYIGGSQDEILFGLAIDNSGNTYVTGATVSTDFPVTPTAQQPVFGGRAHGGIRGDVFIARFSGFATSSCALSALPAITSVNSAGDYGGFSTFASGSWLEVHGSNLAVDTRLWAGGDFQGSAAPTVLDGTHVSINGIPAFVEYISGQQVNVQAPADSATGPIQITVSTCAGTSAPASLQKAAVAPGMLAPASFNVGGKQYLVALYSDGVTFVGNVGLISGVPFRPAKPGDSITAYGIGFGPVTPPIAPGVIASGQTSIPGIQINFGNQPATLSYAGLAPGVVGLYQFNMTVPSVPDGDNQINVRVGGIAVPQTLYLTVQQ